MSPRLPHARGAAIPLSHDRRGVAVIEFALLFPLLALVLMGILGYGQYFLLAHSTQQLANDAARATVAGLSDIERRSLARASVAREVGSLPDVVAKTVTTDAEPNGKFVVVTVRVDASAMPLVRMTLLPMPPAVIDRRAVMQFGGEG